MTPMANIVERELVMSSHRGNTHVDLREDNVSLGGFESYKNGSTKLGSEESEAQEEQIP